MDNFDTRETNRSRKDEIEKIKKVCALIRMFLRQINIFSIFLKKWSMYKTVDKLNISFSRYIDRWSLTTVEIYFSTRYPLSKSLKSVDSDRFIHPLCYFVNYIFRYILRCTFRLVC